MGRSKKKSCKKHDFISDHLKQLQVLLRMNLKLIKSCNCRERPLSDFLLPLFAAIARKARLIEHEPCAHVHKGTHVRLCAHR